MARPRDSRSPSPAGSHHSSRRRPKDGDQRMERPRRDDGRTHRRRSRSRSPDVRGNSRKSGGLYSDRIFDDQPRHRERERDRDKERDRERDRGTGREWDHQRRRDRSPDRRNDDNLRHDRRDRDRDRRRSRERQGGPDRSPNRRRERSREVERERRRRDSPGRYGGTANSHTRSARDDSRERRTTTGQSGGRLSNNEEVRISISWDNSKKWLADHLPLLQTKSSKSQNAENQEDEKKAERRARMEAWKRKKEIESQKQQDVNPDQTRNLLAEMDKKASAATSVVGSATASPLLSPAPASQAEPGNDSPASTYAGKFDPKAIAKKASASKVVDKDILGSPLNVQTQRAATAVKQATAGKQRMLDNVICGVADSVIQASVLPANRAKTSAFGFGKTHGEVDKLPAKRKLDLDAEDETKRKLTKLPALPVETDDTPYADQDEDDDSDGDNFAGTEEEAAAAARAAHEKRLQAEAAAEQPEDTPMEDETATEAAAAPEGEPVSEGPVPNGIAESAIEPTSTMQVDEKPSAPEVVLPAEDDDNDDDDDGVDPLDAFMADLKPAADKKPPKKQQQEPEAYFSEDEYGMDAEGINGAKAMLAMTNKRKKKDIPAVDYSKIELIPIRKNFWVEPAELTSMTEADLVDLRLELDGIKVNGKDVPKPVQKWAHCGLPRATLDVLDQMGFEKPTSIQMQAMPALMSGRDVVGVAKTGSGKTLAFLLPMFRHIKDQPPLKDTDGPIGLIMTPTRELAVQIHKDCKPFLKMMGLRAVCGYGGAPIKDQIAELKRGAEIVVCTPGRIIDLLAANQGRVTNLRRVTYAVLDEADRMFDMGFEPQVMKVFANIRPERQTILFSATMPRIIDSLTKKVLKNPIEITVGGRSVVAKEIEQIVEVREETTKFVRVLELLGELYDQDEDARSLIFVERQEKADDLLKELMTKGYPCMSIHGGKDQIDRDSTISDFKNGIIPILIATSIAARGLDVKQLKLVINYDAPNHLEDYVHRAGRTGRAGNLGVAVTFVTPEQENCAVGITKALEQSEQPVPERLLEMRKAHREKVKSGKAKDTSGFGGKGLDRLDQEREAARLRERKTHKAEGEEEEEKEEKKDDEQKAEKAMDAIKAAVSSIQARQEAQIEAKTSEIKPGRERDALAAAAEGDKSKDPLDKVSSAVSAINNRLGKAGQLRAGQPIDNKGPDAGAFHATLEINDFPQKARWAVTNRTNVAKILEATGTSITTKGNFYPLGKEVPADAEPKLYILIEGDTELVVSSALTDLTRLLREGTIAAADADSRAPASGRYTVT